jgi:hypothetical protein
MGTGLSVEGIVMFLTIDLRPLEKRGMKMPLIMMTTAKERRMTKVEALGIKMENKLDNLEKKRPTKSIDGRGGKFKVGNPSLG